MPEIPTKRTGLSGRLAGVKMSRGRKEPLWKGPEIDGITQSLLNRFLACPERFRLLVCEGLKTNEKFRAPIEYGNMWHVCEEAYAAKKDLAEVMFALRKYLHDLCLRAPLDREDAIRWFRICSLQFPVYVKYWAKNKDVEQRTPLLQEVSFKVPYHLPSGRVVLLRGKWDSVDRIGRGRTAGVYLQENKTKSDIDQLSLQKQLTFDLQTMTYLVALENYLEITDPDGKSGPLRGIRYNVIRRPLSGGRGTIRQHKPTKKKPAGESEDEFFKRLMDDYILKEPEYYFARWKVEVSHEDIERFKLRFLDPVLEHLCNWWEWVSVNHSCPQGVFAPGNQWNWQLPYGVYNVVAEGGVSDVDEYMASGSEVGLDRVETLFPELD